MLRFSSLLQMYPSLFSLCLIPKGVHLLVICNATLLNFISCILYCFLLFPSTSFIILKWDTLLWALWGREVYNKWGLQYMCHQVETFMVATSSDLQGKWRAKGFCHCLPPHCVPWWSPIQAPALLTFWKLIRSSDIISCHVFVGVWSPVKLQSSYGGSIKF